MALESMEIHGQPAVALALPSGDRVTVALHGGHVLSWCTADGVEHLYLSPKAVFDGRSAIRGGVPVCFPQFNQRGPLPKHGFARNLLWVQLPTQDNQIALELQNDERTLPIWPVAFRAQLTVALAPGSLRVTLSVHNADETPLHFTGALHTYLRVDDVVTAQLVGLQGQSRWDAVRDQRFAEPAAALRFGEEFDSVYDAAPAPLVLTDGPRRLRIAQSPAWPQSVVWNPGPVLGAQLHDMPADGWRGMLCVEAAAVDHPVCVAPGATWLGWQELTALA